MVLFVFLIGRDKDVCVGVGYDVSPENMRDCGVWRGVASFFATYPPRSLVRLKNNEYLALCSDKKFTRDYFLQLVALEISKRNRVIIENNHGT